MKKEIQKKLWPYYIKEKLDISFESYYQRNKDKVRISSFNRKLIWKK